MRILGLSPLDKDSTAALIVDGQVVSAIAEERLSRIKMHAGFPYLAVQAILDRHQLAPNDIDKVVYAFHDWEEETRLMNTALQAQRERKAAEGVKALFDHFNALSAMPERRYDIPGVDESELYVNKSTARRLAFRTLSTVRPLGEAFAARKMNDWVRQASADHRRWSVELATGLAHFGLTERLERVEHHLTHAANAYYTSGFDQALIVTLDGYGSGLGGSVSVGEGGRIRRVHDLAYPTSLGEFYERATSALGFRPGRHEGKIVGLAAYESPDILHDVVRAFFDTDAGNVHYHVPHNFALVRYLAGRYSKPAVAAAFQKVLEEVVCDYIAWHVRDTGIDRVVLSGGVVANVKANQRIFEIEGVKQVFVHPNMGDGGCGVGAALAVAATDRPLMPTPINDVYWGQDYSDAEIEAALKAEGLSGTREADIELATARLLADGHIVARFSGRMEYGPRSLGNRSILYHARDPSVNLWLNQKLNRTEFMPFAPATLFEERDRCYKQMAGAEYTAQFMTITFDCTDFMQQSCPAAVHVDGTARPQLVSRESNPGFHKVLSEYHRLTGVPSVINTSFNMHEEPIVCTPQDAIRAFMLGELPYLAIGSWVVAREAADAALPTAA